MKKAQVWGADLIIAMIIFFLGLTSLYLYTINSPQNNKDELNNLIYDGDLIANNIISEGSPTDWNSTNVIQIGILTDGKIDNAKLKNFYNLSIIDYSRTKAIFNTKYNYLFNLSESIFIDSQRVAGIGNVSIPSNINEDELIKITRFTIYNNKPTTAYVYIWREE